MSGSDLEAHLQGAVDRWMEKGFFSAVCLLVAQGEQECAVAVSDPTISVNSLLDLASLTKLMKCDLRRSAF